MLQHRRDMHLYHLSPTLRLSASSSQTIDKMQAQIATMRKDGAQAEDEDRPAFNIDSLTEGYCGMCNVPGYVL